MFFSLLGNYTVVYRQWVGTVQSSLYFIHVVQANICWRVSLIPSQLGRRGGSKGVWFGMRWLYCKCSRIHSVLLSSCVIIITIFLNNSLHKHILKGAASCCEGLGHRRRIKTEEKENVVLSVWGEEFIKLIVALAVLHWTI